MPLPLTVTDSVSKSAPPWNSVKVIVPVGWKPARNTAASVRVTGFGPSVTVAGTGRGASAGVAAGAGTCSVRFESEGVGLGVVAAVGGGGDGASGDSEQGVG